MRIKVNTTGIKSVSRNLRIMGERIHEANRKALAEHADVIADKSQVLVPIDTYRLKESMTNDEYDLVDMVSRQITYSGFDEAGFDYGLFQHESIPVKVQPGTTWKYLSGPFDEEQSNLRSRVVKAVEDVIR